MIKGCVQISGDNQRQRNSYFESLQQFIDRAKMRIEGTDLY
jgi:hypothetical protein